MVAVVACVPLQYDGRAVAPGETFGALPIDALVLRHQGKVTWDRLRFYKRPPPPPPPPPVEAPAPKRRNYRRRDMAPEALVDELHEHTTRGILDALKAPEEP